MPVIILVADGARPDTLQAAIDGGGLPNLARLRAEGGMHTVTTAWPSVTGVAYTPFLLGRYPGPVGLPGLRWFDRTRDIGRVFGHSRSYVGSEMRRVDGDLSADAPTIFELAGSSLGALNVIGRGLPGSRRLGRGARFVVRAAMTHFRGDVRGWLDIDRDIGAQVAHRIRRDRPDFVFAAFVGIDKTSHAQGHDATVVHDAMQIVDEIAAEIRHDAERAGTWEETHLWIVSDHGHSPVESHDDLALHFRDELGFRTLAHPWTFGNSHDVAVMVSGNAMAHVYLELARRERPFWPALEGRWAETLDTLLTRDSVDLALVPHSPSRVAVHGNGRGHAMIERTNGHFSYRPESGDPLGIGPLEQVDAHEAFDATAASDYPDAVVQVAHMAGAARAGEVMLSAARGWDFREKYEPIPHFSSHGALHRDHMLVPLLLNRPAASPPRRTVDVMPSALAALGLPVPAGLDGKSFV
ncbi:MAG: alkaline phosphatase family protein [Gemmatimonadaceae bacterium]